MLTVKGMADVSFRAKSEDTSPASDTSELSRAKRNSRGLKKPSTDSEFESVLAWADNKVEKDESSDEEKGSSFNFWVIIIGVVIVALLIWFILGYIFKEQDKTPHSGSTVLEEMKRNEFHMATQPGTSPRAGSIPIPVALTMANSPARSPLRAPSFAEAGSPVKFTSPGSMSRSDPRPGGVSNLSPKINTSPTDVIREIKVSSLDQLPPLPSSDGKFEYVWEEAD